MAYSLSHLLPTDIDECSGASHEQCEHECVNTPGSYQCQCEIGFLLGENGTCSGIVDNIISPVIDLCLVSLCHANLNADIDECFEGTDDCEQMCINTHGSFTCSCNKGYGALDNGRSCVGIVKYYLTNWFCY